MRYIVANPGLSVFYVIALLVAGCSHAGASTADIELRGFSQRNYAALDRMLGNNVCISGRLWIDSMGVYYPLQPDESAGVLDPGFSRVKIDLSRSLALQNGLSNRRVHTLCGLLRESTPFQGCDTSDCKWYSLTGVQFKLNS